MGRSQHIPRRVRAKRRLAADHLNCCFNPFEAIRMVLFVRDGVRHRRTYPHKRQTIYLNCAQDMTLVEEKIDGCKVPEQIVSNNSAQK
jgi:hypothetical protein